MSTSAMTSEKEISHSEVTEFLNSEFGGDISKLQNAEAVLEKIINWEKELKCKLVPCAEVSQISNFSQIGEDALREISKMMYDHENLQTLARKKIETLKPIKDSFLIHLQSIRQLENAYSYLQWISAIETANDSIEEAVKQNLTSEIVSHFAFFKILWGKLRGSDCKNLLNYCENTMLYWHGILREKFGSEFQKILSNFHWPVLFTTLSLSLKTSPDTVTKFKNLFVMLHRIQLPDDYKPSAENNKAPAEYAPFLLPLQLMFEPLEKRFYFHFISKKQTNRIDKPEWYLAQILTWISDHESFLKQIVQPLLEEKGLDSVQAFEEFMRCLVQLAISRLRKDLPTLLTDDGLLSHTIDEIFLFERELQNQGYPKFYPTTLEVLSTEPCFSRWRSLEHKSALEKMDRLLNSETAWKSRYQEEEDLDDLRVPECAEMFITLLLTMTERYRYSLKEQHQLSFMELQLELLDDFRLRLHQLSQFQVEETLDPKYCAIVNAVNYILIVLNEWSNLPFFLKLYSCMKERDMERQFQNSGHSKIAHRSKSDDEEEEKMNVSVFDDAIILLDHMQKDLLITLCERVMLDIKAKSRGYRKEKWFCIPTIHDKKLLEVSPLAYPLLDVINSSLQGLCDLLAKPLFTSVWQNIARELNIYLYEEVILQNSFSEGGAEQLNFDMTRNLFPIFGSYTLKPENYFRLVKESCILLNLSPAPAILLKDALKQQEKFEERISILAELGIHSLTPSQASVILSQRNDLTS